ncbi:hypothetical protein HPB49_016050 [Dermacentor silvarum]|uniref:Uncharacterized protein n=1 Tax=Dermacentor silvarum TaxID=543639 RepID=A0ACB8CYC0_DERSI|nr:hypothetical protein HPB49_016050 [Dermacentor silvarum]
MTDADAISAKAQRQEHRRSSIEDGGLGIGALSLVWFYGFVVGCPIGLTGLAFYAYLSPAAAKDTPPRPKPKPEAVCYSPSCLATAELLRDNLNPLVGPCDDFQGHVCSRYAGPLPSLLLNELSSVQSRAVASLRNMDESVQGARRKAADMFRACERRHRDRSKQHEVLHEFMARLRLSISDPPPVGSLSTPDGLLKLHVELAFVYELSGLFFLRPAMPRSIRMAADLSFMRASDSYPTPDLFFEDMMYVNGHHNPELAKKGLALHNTMTLAVATATRQRDDSTSGRAPYFVKVLEVSFGGVSAGAFAAAVEEKTPYKRDSHVELDPVIPGVLEVVWKRVTIADLYHWTSWHVLEECATHVDPFIASNTDNEALSAMCIKRVYLVLGPPAAAVEFFRLVTPEVQDRVSRLIRSVAECLATKASRWVREFDVQPVVGFSPSANTVQTLDSRYASIPAGNGSSFLADWIRAAEVRSRKVSPEDAHVDELQVDVSVSPEGHVVVPALFVTSRLFSTDGPSAVDYGGLGHIVTRSMIRRCRTTYRLFSTREDDVEQLPCVGEALAGVRCRLLLRLPAARLVGTGGMLTIHEGFDVLWSSHVMFDAFNHGYTVAAAVLNALDCGAHVTTVTLGTAVLVVSAASGFRVFAAVVMDAGRVGAASLVSSAVALEAGAEDVFYAKATVSLSTAGSVVAAANGLRIGTAPIVTACLVVWTACPVASTLLPRAHPKSPAVASPQPTTSRGSISEALMDLQPDISHHRCKVQPNSHRRVLHQGDADKSQTVL